MRNGGIKLQRRDGTMKKRRFNGFHVVCPIVIYIFTFGWARCMTIFPFVFYKNKYNKMNERSRQHETIHIRQQMETGLVGFGLFLLLQLTIRFWFALPVLLLFYIIYFINWIVNVFKWGRKAYVNIAFEREAYQNASVTDYLKTRKPFAWMKYIS